MKDCACVRPDSVLRSLEMFDLQSVFYYAVFSLRSANVYLIKHRWRHCACDDGPDRRKKYAKSTAWSFVSHSYSPKSSMVSLYTRTNKNMRLRIKSDMQLDVGCERHIYDNIVNITPGVFHCY